MEALLVKPRKAYITFGIIYTYLYVCFTDCRITWSFLVFINKRRFLVHCLGNSIFQDIQGRKIRQLCKRNLIFASI